MRHRTEADKAYMAGMIDGEGCVNISKRMPQKGLNYSYRLELIISNNHKPMLEHLQHLWGGRIHKAKGRAHWQLKLAAVDTEDALMDAHPYLIVKRDQTDIVFEFLNTFALSGPERFSAREALFLRLKASRLRTGNA